jgi:hypothetical protein
MCLRLTIVYHKRKCRVMPQIPPLPDLLIVIGNYVAGHQCPMPVVLPTQEAEIRNIKVQCQPGQKARPYLKNAQHKIGMME